MTPSRRRPALGAAPLLAALLLLLVAQVARGASSPAHGGGKGNKGRGDGYHQPYAKNAAWKYYKFDVLNSNLRHTSLRLMPGSDDPTQPGTVNTVTGELFNAKGEQLGVNHWTRTVVGEDPLGSSAERVVTYLISLQYEFGTVEDGYFDDTIALSTVSKRSTAADAPYFDFDAAILGGTGKFLGATGKVSISDAVFEDGNLVVSSAMIHFDVYVPNNLPPKV